jgi:GNAT superfamily N-acetyltransferase
MSTPFSLEALADLNLAQAARIHHRWQPAARLLDELGLLCHQGTAPIPAPFQNCMIRVEPQLSAAEAIDQADAFFGGASNPYAVLTSTRQDADLIALLPQRGFTQQSDLAVMLADAPLSQPVAPAGWRVEPVEPGEPGAQADVADFVQVCAQAYESLGLPSFFTPMFFVERSGLPGPEVSITLARNEAGQAGAAAMTLHTGEVAGLYWVATLPSARGLGLAAACSAQATNLAFEHGARAVALQASPMGDAIYRRLGYREIHRTARWSR